MYKPLLYITNCPGPEIISEQVLKKNIHLLQNYNNTFVLDVGCGPGNITFEKVLPMLPETTKNLIGVDISNGLLEYARKRYQGDPRVSYRQMNIVNETLPQEFLGFFDLVVSIYCLHFVGKHRKAFSNIYAMLKADGKILISFIKNFFVHDIYRSLYNNQKWKPMMFNFKNVVHSHQSNEARQKMLEDIGFSEIECDEIERPVFKTEESVRNALNALNMFRVPDHLETEFIQDQVEYLEKNGYLSMDSSGKKIYNFSYTVLTITANKKVF